MGRHFWRHKKLLETGSPTLQLKNSAEIALSSTVFEIHTFLCFAFLKKFENSIWPPFLVSEIFVET